LNWIVFWKLFLSNDDIFLHFFSKIPKEIFKNNVQHNILILAQKFEAEYRKRPNVDDMLVYLTNLPELEKENGKAYVKFLEDVGKLETSVDPVVFRDQVEKEMRQFELEHFILAMANKVGIKDPHDLIPDFNEAMEKITKKKVGEEIDTRFFLNVNQAIDRHNRDLSKVDPTKLPKYSIKCLNDFMFGMFPGELIVIGADTGVGKSQLSCDIARVNAMAGRKVYLICLEGSKNEVMARYKYEIIAREYYKKPTGMPMSYPLYNANMLTGIEKYETIAELELSKMEGNLVIYGKSEVSFTIDTLLQQMGRIRDADLVIVDHLHYFSMLDDSSEAQQLSEIMRRVKDLTQIHNIPVILVSHLRRKSKDRKIPDNDDFHGSSNIAKIADTTILLMPIYGSDALDDKDMCPTIIRLGKSRDGLPTYTGFRVRFDPTLRRYQDFYELSQLSPYKDPVVIERPNWPKFAVDIVGRTEFVQKTAVIATAKNDKNKK